MTSPQAMTEREAERAAIVAWLRANADRVYGSPTSFRDRVFYAWTAIRWPNNLMTGHLRAVANKIEAGQHVGGGE